jgi:pimeloyl-ACP methyl ester carboxylesterase
MIFLHYTIFFLCLSAALCLPYSISAAEDPDTVVLLHGLGRTPRSMASLEERLAGAGYNVVNLAYPSRKEKIETLIVMLQDKLQARNLRAAGRLHFVTHSLGGILVRAYLAANRPANLGRVVMLSPPNKGSDVVDFWAGSSLFAYFFGPAAAELGTGPDSLPNRLGPADYEVGIITGSRTIDPVSSWIIDGKDDGRISIKQARLEGMVDFKVVKASHAFIMAKKKRRRRGDLFSAERQVFPA